MTLVSGKQVGHPEQAVSGDAEPLGDLHPVNGDPPLRKLRKRWQFLAAAKGRVCSRGAVVVQMLSREDVADPAIGVGFTATRKIGGAVVRNRAKRRMREAARRLLPLHGLAGHDYVFIARAGAPEREWILLLDDMTRALIGLQSGGDDPKPARRPQKRSGPARYAR